MRGDHIGIHIRCGDYLSDTRNQARFGAPNVDYFRRAIELLSTECDFKTILLVSDEPDLAWQLIGKDLRDYSGMQVEMNPGTLEEDFCALAASRAVVLSNSTFSWWAAWLGTALRNAPVVFPEPWYLDRSMDAKGLAYPGWHPVPR